MILADYVRAPVQTVYVKGAAYYAGSLLTSLPIAGGSVTADCRRTKMRDASVSLGVTETLTHAQLYAILQRPGVEVTLERGFVGADGSTLGAALGRFVVDELTYQRTDTGTTLTATLSDLSERVSRNRWTDPYTIASSTALAAALNTLIMDRYPDASSGIKTGTTPGTLAAQVVLEGGDSSDPWADAFNLAAAYGFALYFDGSGVLQAKPAPTLDAGAAVFSFPKGTYAVMTQQTRVSALQRTYNGVIVTGESPDLAAPVRGEAWDTQPLSPTYYLGPFGKVPMFYSSSLIPTADQAATVASAMLTGVLGHVEQLSWGQVVHPGLKPLDVITVELATGVLTPYIIDSITIPLTVTDAATAIAREIVVNY